jgi:GR25 family glycosyltransferase involved in LPS biosynthesis
MESVDVIFYINLASRVDRKYHFLSEISKLCVDSSKIVRIEAVYDSMGALGCSKSHIKALETFMANPAWKTCIVFEDDFTFYHDSHIHNNNLLKEFFMNFMDWDMLLLSSNQRTPSIVTSIPSIEKVSSSQTTSGYLIHKESVKKLYDNFKEGAELLAVSLNKPLHALDMYWENAGLVRYAFRPNMGYQYASISDVENTFVNYGV